MVSGKFGGLRYMAALSTCAALAWLMGIPGAAQAPAAGSGGQGSAESTALTVRARCKPCTIEIGRTTTLTAEPDRSAARLTYKWSASTGKFADATAPQTQWTAPTRGGWSEERWKKDGPDGVPLTVTVEDGRGATATGTVTVYVTRPAPK